MTSPMQHQRWLSGITLRAAGTWLALAVMLTVVATESAPAQTYAVLYTFTGGKDRGNSLAGLVRDAKGNLYGTTNKGGASNSGTVFKLDTTNKTVLYSFKGGKDGAFPLAGLLRDSAGNLYGTTGSGGGTGCKKNAGCGTVFKVAKAKETVLYRFTGGADGGAPWTGTLLRDAKDNLYDTTGAGGASNAGTVFKLDTANKETVLYSFTGGTDGGLPLAGLVQDTAGNLYSTTFYGGADSFGVVFKLDTTDKETMLLSFNRADGADSFATVLRDAKGNVYGTTEYGGTGCKSPGCGTVFKLSTTGKETVLYSFTGGADGGYPLAGLVRDSAGNLYGTATKGGGSGDGVVFKLDKTGKETVLHSFGVRTGQIRSLGCSETPRATSTAPPTKGAEQDAAAPAAESCSSSLPK